MGILLVGVTFPEGSYLSLKDQCSQTVVKLRNLEWSFAHIIITYLQKTTNSHQFFGGIFEKGHFSLISENLKLFIGPSPYV